jgi:hypothetical protein
MPMRDELFIPEGHPLYKAGSLTDAWRRVLEDPDLNIIVAFSSLGLFVAPYLAIHCPLPESIFVALLTMS